MDRVYAKVMLTGDQYKKVKETAKSRGLSVSAFFRKMAVEEIKKSEMKAKRQEKKFRAKLTENQILERLIEGLAEYYALQVVEENEKKQCEYCGKEFEPTRRGTKSCSKNCNSAE